MSYFVFCCLLFICLLPRFGKKNLFSAIDYLLLRGFCSEGLPLPLGAWDRLLYFV